MRQGNDGFHDRERIVFRTQTANKRLIDLQESNGQLLQMAQGRIPGSEIVQAGVDSLRLDLGKRLAYGIRIFHHFRLGDLDLETRRIEAGPGDLLLDQLPQLILRKMLNRKIDAESQWPDLRKLLLPEFELTASFAKRPFSDGLHQAKFGRNI